MFSQQTQLDRGEKTVSQGKNLLNVLDRSQYWIQ